MKRVWKTKDGTKLLISQMDNDHLLNAINFCEKRAKAQQCELVDFYATTDGPNGEMAQMAFEQEQNQIFNSHWTEFLPDEYDSLVYWAKKRGLIPEEFPF